MILCTLRDLFGSFHRPSEQEIYSLMKKFEKVENKSTPARTCSDRSQEKIAAVPENLEHLFVLWTHCLPQTLLMTSCDSNQFAVFSYLPFVASVCVHCTYLIYAKMRCDPGYSSAYTKNRIYRSVWLKYERYTLRQNSVHTPQIAEWNVRNAVWPRQIGQTMNIAQFDHYQNIK